MQPLRKEPQIPAVRMCTVEAGDEGQRLDNFLLRQCKGVPKSHIYRILRSGEVRVNSGRAAADYRIAVGDQIRIPPLRLPAKPAEEVVQKVAHASRKAELPVIFEDEAMLVLNKPAGLAVHGGSGVAWGVIEALRHQRPDARFIELAHRLDRETSGLLLVGKKRSSLKMLHEMFRHGTADKRYLALVAGEWTDTLRHVKLALNRTLTVDGERRVKVDDDEGQESHTIFRLLRRGKRFSLLEAQLKTGRTHQIRVHLAHLGFPIVGDDKYGDFALNKALQREGLKRMFLHAWKIGFPHPVSGDKLNLSAPLPEELRRFLAKIEAEGGIAGGAPL
jgi:23S rRNA pseudouridine955/2504/2580 synthase